MASLLFIGASCCAVRVNPICFNCLPRLPRGGGMTAILPPLSTKYQGGGIPFSFFVYFVFSSRRFHYLVQHLLCFVCIPIVSVLFSFSLCTAVWFCFRDLVSLSPLSIFPFRFLLYLGVWTPPSPKHSKGVTDRVAISRRSLHIISIVSPHWCLKSS